MRPRVATGFGISASPDNAVSSTKIRKALEEGRIDDANRMLGYRYSLQGVVVAGNRLGRTIGFPTANMKLFEPLKLVPARGVYAVDVEVLGKTWRGMTNIGMRPTVGGTFTIVGASPAVANVIRITGFSQIFRDLTVDPASIGSPIPDDTIREGGLKVSARAWTTAGRTGEAVPVVFTEFADPSGQEGYFRVPDLSNATPIAITDDEIVSL